MSARSASFRVTNQRGQPVELHVAEEAVVLSPFAAADVTVVTAQLGELERRGLITIEQLRPAAPSQPPVAKKAAPKKAAPKKAAAKKAAAKRTVAAKKAKKAAATASPRRHPAPRGGN